VDKGNFNVASYKTPSAI